MSQITYMNYAKDGQHASFQNTTTTTTQWYTTATSKPAASTQLLRKGSGKGSVRKIAKNRDPFTPMSSNVSPATSISRSSSASSTNTKTFASSGAAAKSAAARKPAAAPKVSRPQVIAEAPLSTPRVGQAAAAAAASEHENADEPPLFVRKIRASERRNGSIRRRSLRLDIPQTDRKESWFKNIPHISSSISSSFRRQVSKSRPLPIEFLDHSCLTSFSEILPGTASPSVGSPSEEEIDELDSEHVAYSLAFVEDYIEPPVGFSVTQETVDVLSPLETSQRCQSCNGKFSGTVLELCECCQTVLCKECFGPLVFSFQFPRVDKATGKRIQTPDPNRQQRIKELCQRCMKCCAGPKKRDYCRLKEFGQHYNVAGASADAAPDHQAISRVAVDRTPASLARRHRTSTGSRYSMHQRQLTQLSIQIAGVHAAGGGGPGWTAKMAAFFYKVTTSFTIWSQPLRINGFFSWAEESKRSRIASPELEDEEQ
ncbi:hypothetical protein BZA70DRAFT_289343 [Myxozyma melibiosi]|uniref:Uncharacterized protein n=1 Tax=Myxozyma melibiosi TaxID=54550 RepID=A0ABR1F6F1_9ASCO